MLLFLLPLLPIALALRPDYTGHQLVRTQPFSIEQVEALAALGEKGVDLWSHPAMGRALDMRVQPHQVDMVSSTLASLGLTTSLLSSSLEEFVKASPMVPANSTLRSGHSMDWTNYHPIEDIHSYLDYLEATFDFVTTETIGKSYDGSDMRIVKVCKGGCGNKPAMWFDGGIHAREWVSPAVATYMTMELIENDAAHPDLTTDLDWYILPVVNPDGYLFTQTDDRFWRKTRSPNGGSCYGCDPNRNWGFHWGTGGSSSDPCSETYMGSEAFSEVENRNVRDFLTANKDQIKFYNNIHSYSQLILLPWGWGLEQPDNYDDLYSMAMLGHDALKAVHGKEYEVGCIPCMLYVASGGTLDWTLGELGIPYSYAMELRDTGKYGFLLPPDQIIPTGEEVWAFHITVAREIVQEFGSSM